jgi:hypothetical protein
MRNLGTIGTGRALENTANRTLDVRYALPSKTPVREKNIRIGTLHLSRIYWRCLFPWHVEDIAGSLYGVRNTCTAC